MTQTNNANLDLLSEIAGTVDVGGQKNEVHDLDGLGYRELRAAEGTDRYTDVAYATVGRLVPTLTPAQVDKLTGKKVGVILAIADGRVADTESQLPNGSRPAAT